MFKNALLSVSTLLGCCMLSTTAAASISTSSGVCVDAQQQVTSCAGGGGDGGGAVGAEMAAVFRLLRMTEWSLLENPRLESTLKSGCCVKRFQTFTQDLIE